LKSTNPTKTNPASNKLEQDPPSPLEKEMSEIWDRYTDSEKKSEFFCASIHIGYEGDLERVREILADSLKSVGVQL